MDDNDKSKAELVAELQTLRQRLTTVEEQYNTLDQVEARWQESERRYRTLLDNLPGVVYRCQVDSNWTMEFLSDGIVELSGYQAEDFLGNQRLSYGDIIHPDDQAQVKLDVEAAVSQEQPFLINYRIITRQGVEKWVWERGIAVTAPGSDSPTLEGFILDVTNQRQLLEALENERGMREAKNRFVSMMSHEFRNPLAGIASSAGLLKRYYDKMSQERRGEIVDGIQVLVDQLTDLLDDMLLIFRADVVGITPQTTPTNPLELYREILRELEQIDEFAHRIELTHQGSFDNIVMDRKLLRRCISNLLSNAIKYSPGGAVVQVDLLSDGHELTFRVKDEGIGIPAEDQPFLFDVFHRASNVGNIPGTGLGLVIARQSVEAQGGSISCESEIGVGTTFTVRLPLHVERA